MPTSTEYDLPLGREERREDDTSEKRDCRAFVRFVPRIQPRILALANLDLATCSNAGCTDVRSQAPLFAKALLR